MHDNVHCNEKNVSNLSLFLLIIIQYFFYNLSFKNKSSVAILFKIRLVLEVILSSLFID